MGIGRSPNNLKGIARIIARRLQANIGDPGLGNESDGASAEPTASAFEQINNAQARLTQAESDISGLALQQTTPEYMNPFAGDIPALVDVTASIANFEYQMADDDYNVECKAAAANDESNTILLPLVPVAGKMYRVSTKLDNARKGILRVGVFGGGSVAIPSIFPSVAFLWDGAEWRTPGTISEKIIAYTAADWFFDKMAEDDAFSATDWSEKTVTCSGVLENDTITLGGSTYTFKATPTTSTHVRWTENDEPVNAAAFAAVANGSNAYRVTSNNEVISIKSSSPPSVATINGTRLAIATVAGISNTELDTNLAATDAIVEEVTLGLRETATITIDAAVDGNTLTLNGTALTYGVGGIGAAVVAGTAGERNIANAILMASAIEAEAGIFSATPVNDTVLVVAEVGTELVFTAVTPARLAVVADAVNIPDRIRTVEEDIHATGSGLLDRMNANDQVVGASQTALADTATITCDLCVDTNTFTLNGVVYAFGAGAYPLLGAAVVAGDAPTKDNANALLIETAIEQHDDVYMASVDLGVVTVTAKPGRVLKFSSVTATRLVVADTSPAYGIFAQIRAAL